MEDTLPSGVQRKRGKANPQTPQPVEKILRRKNKTQKEVTMTKQFADIRSAAVPLPASCPAEFRKKILEIRSGKAPQRKPVAVPVVAAQSADEVTESDRVAAHRKVTKAKLALLT